MCQIFEVEPLHYNGLQYNEEKTVAGIYRLIAIRRCGATSLQRTDFLIRELLTKLI